MKRIIFTIAFIVFSSFVIGQTYFGQILDINSKEPIAFANIRYASQQGLISDIDGRYQFETHKKIDSLIISYVGYKQKIVSAKENIAQKIYLTPETFELNEVVITAKDDPALRIVKNLSRNIKKHQVDNLNSYQYKAYDKFYFTGDKPHDSLIKENPVTHMDSLYIRMKKFLEEQHLFLIENITEVTYKKPQKKQEKVLSSRMSGFKSPLFNLLLSQMQPTDFYEKQINIGNQSFPNPFMPESLNKYWYVMKDTLINQQTHDSSFVIAYYPKQEGNFKGVRGTATISSNGWAFRNITAREDTEGRATTEIVIEQNYQQIDDKTWFPTQLNTKMILNTVQINRNSPLIGVGKRYLFDIQLNENTLSDINPAIAFKYSPNAYNNYDTVLQKYRQIPFDEKDRRTYEMIDSLSKAEQLEEISLFFKDLLYEGKISLGKISFPISDISNYNDYEGFRLGITAETNNNFSRYIKLGSYIAYGFKDKALKYGGAINLFFDHYQNHSLNYSYKKDVFEPGTYLNNQFSLFNADNFRNFNLSRFDKVESHTLSISTKPIKNVTLTPSISRQDIEPTYLYTFRDHKKFYNQFTFLEASLSLRIAFGEKFIQTPSEEISLGTKYPIINLEIKKGIKNSFNDIDYLSALLKIKYSFKINYLGKTSINSITGHVNNNVPIQKLFHGRGNHSGWFNLNSPQSFATMEFGRFYHTSFTALFIEHNFNDLLLKTKYFFPDISIVQNVLYGRNKYLDHHYNIDIDVASKGYFESGIVLNRMIKLGFSEVGLGFFYRYGIYADKKFSKDLSILLAYRIKI